MNPPTNEEISADGKNNDSCSPPRETDQREDGALEGDNGAVNGYTRGGSGSSDEEENVPEINKMSKMVVDKDLDKSIEDRLDILHLYFQQALNDGTIQDGEKMLNEAERLGLKNKASLLLANVLFTEDLVQQIKIYRDLLLRFCMNDAKAQRHLLGGIEQKVSSKKDVLLPKTAHIIFALYINGICDEEVLISWGKKPSSKYVKKDFVNEMIKVAKPMLKCIEGLFPDTEAEDGLAIAFDDHSRTVGTNVEKKKEKKEGVDNKASTGEYIVEEILGKYGKKYIVKWEGFDETTYECRENLKHLRVFKEFEIYSSCDNYSRAFDRVRRKPGLKALRKIFHINDEDQEEESVECTVQTASRPVADMTIESLPVQRNQKPKLRKQQRKDTVKNVNSTIQTVSRPVADMTFEALPAQRNQKPKLRKQTSKPENESKKKRCETCKNCGELFFTDKVHRCIEKSEFNLTMDSIIITDDDEISQPPSPQQPSASTSLFGAKPADSLFGSNISQPSSFFGQQQQERVVVIDCDDDEISRPPSPPPASTSLFGAKPAGSLFGTNISQPTFFGQQQPGGLFGTTTSAPAFGATTTSISMSSNPVSSFSSFGQPPQQGGGLFGAKPAQPFASFGVNQPIQQFGTASTGTSLFGQQPQTSIGGGLFGSTSTANKPSLFGSTIGTQQPSGLFNTVKFTPPTGTDTMQLKGQQTQVSTKQMCISAMKEFDSKSLEEIRCADYISGKKVSSSAPASTGSLFGKQPQGALFGTTVSTSGGFFSVPSSTTTASSLFGSQQQTASTSLFGAKPAGSLFGTNISQPSGGIFGQPQPGSSGFAMGGNKSTSAFTTQPTFFTQQQPGGLFGTTTTSAPAFGATTTSTSIFGNTVSSFTGFGQPPQQGGGLFGAKPAPPFGSFGVNQPTQQFGTASTGTSLFGQQPQTSIGGGLFGSTSTANKPSLFGSTIGTQQPSGLFNTANVQQPFVSNLTLSSTMNIGNLQKSIIDAQLSTLPYGDSPLLKVSTSPRKSAQDISSLQRQLTFDTKDGQKSPQQNSFLADLSVVSTISKGTQDLSTKDTSLAESAIFDTNLSYKPIIILPSVGFGAALGLRHSPKLTKSFASEKSFLSGKSSLHSFIEEDKKIKSLDMSVVFEPSHTENVIYVEKPQVNSVVVPLQLSPSEDSERPTIEEIPSPTATPPPSKEIVQQKTTKIPSSVQQPPKKYRIKLTRPEYYSEPKIEDLECLFNQNGVCIIEGGLTIGRLGYGSVFWKGPLELTEPLDLDEIVHFRNKEVIVYPDESKKPEIGFGLNKPAEVSLDNVWPIDSKTKMPIKDADELRKMNFRGKLERLCLRMDANFCDYLPATGTWQFQVQHFSKYGFQEEEDEDIEVDNNIIQQQNIDINNLNQLEVKRKAVQLQTLVQKAKVPLREIQKFSGEKQQNKREYVQQQQQNNQLIDYINVDDEFNEGINEQFFDDSKLFQEEIIRKKIRFDDTLFDSSKLLTHVTNKEQQQIDYQKPKLVERTPKYIYEGLTRENLKNSILSKSGISIQFPSCRIGFTQDLIFASVPPSTHLNVVNIYQTRVIIPTVKNFFLQYIRSNGLNQQQSLLNLEISSLVKFDPPSPILSFLDEFLTESFEAGKKDLNQSFFEICKILLMETKNIEDKISQRTLMGNWLFNQLENNSTTKPLNQTKPFLTIFNFLINGNVKKASEYARDMKLFNLALLICCYQTTSVGIVRNLVAKQLSIAQKHKNSDINYLKILQLLSGEFVKESSGGCLQGLNWLQVLGILIWYHSSPTTTLIECLDILQELMN